MEMTMKKMFSKRIKIVLLFMLILIGFNGTFTGKEKAYAAPYSSISLSAIEGVTPPVTGETLVTEITETDEYTGVVYWNPSTDTFLANMTYRATIELTPKTGYSLAGVDENFFTVAGATTIVDYIEDHNRLEVTFPATTSIAYSGEGSGTLEDPYLIDSAAQLNEVRYHLSSHFKLISDIDLSSYSNWEPIGLEAYPFTGSLKGNGFVIRNATSDRLQHEVGLFVKSSGLLKDIKLEAVNISGQISTGGLVGINAGTILNSYVIGDITGHFNTGGLAGANAGTIMNSYAIGNIKGIDGGGLVGSNSGTITNSYAVVSSAIGDIGGLVGGNSGMITSSYYDSEVSGLSDTDKGEPRTTAEMSDEATYENWDFNKIWYMSDDGYLKHKDTSILETITLSAISGVTAPVAGATPVTSITETDEYTGTVVWSPAATTFAGSKVYTANITLTPKEDYTTIGVNEDFFTVAGATTVSNAANTGVVTAIFPATASVPSGTLPVPPSTGVAPAAPAEEEKVVPNPPKILFFKELIDQKKIEKLIEKANTHEEVKFKDVDEHSKQYETTAIAAKLGIITGDEQGLFHPNTEVTRAEFSTMLVRALGLEKIDEHQFVDTKDHWAADAIAILSSHGIINGYQDGTFKPNQTISRAEISTMLARLLNVSLEKKGKFADTIGTWAEAEIDTLSDLSIVKGTEDGRFSPQDKATKYEAVLLILRMLSASVNGVLNIE